jgi:hypothetical protein
MVAVEVSIGITEGEAVILTWVCTIGQNSSRSSISKKCSKTMRMEGVQLVCHRKAYPKVIQQTSHVAYYRI